VVAEVTDRLAVSKRGKQESDMEAEGKAQYQVKTSNRLRALENLDNDEDINRAWEPLTENTVT
jgi:hypothetical protein